MKNLMILPLVVLFASNGGLIEACTLESLQKLTSCLSSFSSSFGSLSQLQTPDFSRVFDIVCQGDNLHRMLNCTETLIESCRNDTEIYNRISSLLDFDRTRSSYTYLCDNRGELKTQASCVQDHSQKVGNCMMESIKRLSKMFGDEVTSGNPNDTQSFACRSQIIATNCYKQHFGECGNVAKVLSAANEGMAPPACDKFANFTVGPLSSKDEGGAAPVSTSPQRVWFVLAPLLVLLCRH